MASQHILDDSKTPTAASDWKKETLNLLGAKYETRSVTDFSFPGLVLPDELQNGITHFI
jgi:hypothetical protein